MMLALLVACSPEQVVPETEEPVVPEEQTAPTPTETEEEVVPSSEHTVRITS